MTGQIRDLHHRIENIWNERKFLDRNQHTDPAIPVHDQKVKIRSMEAVESKGELTIRIQEIREKRSKLKKKLEDPKATMVSKSKWEIEFTQVEMAIEEANMKRTLL